MSGARSWRSALEALPAARRVRVVRPETGRVQGTVLFIHGYGLHADRFDALYPMLTAHGVQVVALDLPGHGPEGGGRFGVDHLPAVEAAAVEAYEAIEGLEPVVMGVGLFGGWVGRRLVAASVAREADWRPPLLLYSVDYVPVPSRPLAWLQRPGVLRLLDRVPVSFDASKLTHDPEATRRWLDDPHVWTRYPLGATLAMAREIDAFFDAERGTDVAHAFLIGADDEISTLGPVRRAGRRQPDHRLWEIAGGRMHLHRDTPAVQARFQRAVGEALAFLWARAGRPAGGPAPPGDGV